MLILSILMALFSPSENSNELLYNHWILVQEPSKGWMTSTPSNPEIIQFQANQTLSFINIEKGVLKEQSFNLDSKHNIILSDQTTFATIKSLDQDKLVLVYTHGDQQTETTYRLLTESKTKFSDQEIIKTLQSSTWQYRLEQPRGTMIWEISSVRTDDHLNFLLKIQSSRQVMTFPTEIKKVAQSFFLSCQVPGEVVGLSETHTLPRENYFIHLINEDELIVRLGKEIPLATFKKVTL